MRCDSIREALSALLDGEDPGLDRASVDEHLRTCPGCRRWRDDAARINRLAALNPAGDEAPPGLVDTVMDTYRVPRSARLSHLARAGLLVVALLQLGIGVLGLLPAASAPRHGGHGTLPGLDGHLGHEATAFNVAIGAALLWIAAKPRTARGPVPLLAVFVLALTGLSALDLVTGEVGWQRLASHLPAAAGLLLAGVLARLHPAPDPVPGHTSGDDSADTAAGTAQADDHRWATVVEHRPRSGRRPPAARESAA